MNVKFSDMAMNYADDINIARRSRMPRELEKKSNI